MLFDFAMPICRACCNYEGIDKIAEVIEKAKKMRVTEGYQQQQHQQQLHSSMTNVHSRSPHSTEQRVVSFVPAAATLGGASNMRPIHTMDSPSGDGNGCINVVTLHGVWRLTAAAASSDDGGADSTDLDDPHFMLPIEESLLGQQSNLHELVID